MKRIRQTQLRFKKGNSDKVYEVDLIERNNDAYLVNFRYGKYGANLREGSKTKNAVELSQAEKIYNSLVVSKVNKGYKLIAGYDPVSGQYLGAQENDPTSPKVPLSNEERNQKIIERLEHFCEAKKHRDKNGFIDGYTLSRSLWKAGELRVPNLAPVIEKLLHLTFQKERQTVIYYSMLWALGRSGDTKGLALLEQLAKKLPDNLHYMLDEVRLSLSFETQGIFPEFNSDFDCNRTVEKIAAFDYYEKLPLDTLDDEGHQYAKYFMRWQGVQEEVAQALKQVTLNDVDHNVDVNSDYWKQYLSKATCQHIEKGEAAYPHLQDAIDTVARDQHNQQVEQKLEKYQVNYDLYMHLIKDVINLNQVMHDRYYRERARSGRLDWLWGNDKSRLKRALNKTGKVKDINQLWNHVEQYADLVHYQRRESVSTEILAEVHDRLKQADVYPAVLDALTQYRVNDGFYEWERKYLSAEVRSKYEDDGESVIDGLFQDRLNDLRQIALKPKAALLKEHQNTVLGYYTLAQYETDSSHRAAALSRIRLTPVDQGFTQTFRRLYKLAEFRDDTEVLAILNYRIECTTPSQVSYWREQQKPFNQKTKAYFRRRMIRCLRNIAKFKPEAYPEAAKYILLQADDQSTLMQAEQEGDKTQCTFPQLSALNFILHHKSHRFRPTYKQHWFFDAKKQEVKQPEAYPRLWDEAQAHLFELLRDGKAQLVNDFAYRRLQDETDFLARVKPDDWLILVQKPYENTALLALEYLQADLQQLKVMKAVLAAEFDSVRAKALAALDGESLGEQPDLLRLMLLSKHQDVARFARDYLYTAQAYFDQLSEQLLAHLIDLEDEQEQTRLIPVIEWLLLNPLKGKASLLSIRELLAHSALALQHLATLLLESSSYTFEQLQDCYQLMIASSHADIRAGAIALLAKLADEEKLQYQDLLLAALLDEHASLREKARHVLASIDNRELQQTVFNHLLPHLFKAEPFEGFADDTLAMLLTLEPIYTQIDRNVLWRLLTAKSKLADWAGALILTKRQASEFSVKQLALLSKHPTLSVRDWSLSAFENKQQLILDDYTHAIRLLDNRWDDTRQRAITLFSQFEQDFWTRQRMIGVCDNVYDDVQRFGRDLMTRFFDEEQGEAYIRQLSQHPSVNVQLFVSSFLDEYAFNRPELTLSLEDYFHTTLSQVNRGRLIKDRVIFFLFHEAKQYPQIAEMVARLFSEHSISLVIADKMQYIKTLFEIQKRFPHIATPVKVIEPEVRAV